MRYVRTGSRDNPTGSFTEKGKEKNTHASASAPHVLTSASYVQMLERQPLQMIAGIQELDRRLCNNAAWPWLVSKDDLGPQPLTYKILKTLSILPGPWDETGHVRNALGTAPQSHFDVGLSNSLSRLPECSPSYGVNDGPTSSLECSPSYGANDGWMPTPESHVVCTESLQLAYMDHGLPTTDDSQPLSSISKVELSLQLIPPFSSFLTFSHPSNIPFQTGVI